LTHINLDAVSLGTIAEPRLLSLRSCPRPPWASWRDADLVTPVSEISVSFLEIAMSDHECATFFYFRCHPALRANGSRSVARTEAEGPERG